MANIPGGTEVALDATASAALRFPPPAKRLTVVCHPMALHAPSVFHTQVAVLQDGGLEWIGALGEDLLAVGSVNHDMTPRNAVARHVLTGPRLWEIIRPGSLLKPGTPSPLSTIYDGSDLRPWVVLGQTATGDLIAAPLNEANNPRHFTPVIPASGMVFPGNAKDSQVEVSHLWSLPCTFPKEGEVLAAGIAAVEDKIRNEYRLQRA